MWDILERSESKCTVQWIPINWHCLRTVHPSLCTVQRRIAREILFQRDRMCSSEWFFRVRISMWIYSTYSQPGQRVHWLNGKQKNPHTDRCYTNIVEWFLSSIGDADQNDKKSYLIVPGILIKDVQKIKTEPKVITATAMPALCRPRLKLRLRLRKAFLKTGARKGIELKNPKPLERFEVKFQCPRYSRIQCHIRPPRHTGTD